MQLQTFFNFNFFIPSFDLFFSHLSSSAIVLHLFSRPVVDIGKEVGFSEREEKKKRDNRTDMPGIVQTHNIV